MTREQAIEKIKKLQTLKEGAEKIQSDGEAKNAAAIIVKLQKQFGITMQEVYGYTSNKTTTDNSSVKNEYTEEQREKAINTLHEKLYTHFHGYIKYYVHEKDPDVRYEITAREIENYRDFILDNETLVGKCINNGMTYAEYQAIVEEECQNALDTLNDVCDKMQAEIDSKKQKHVTFKIKENNQTDEEKVSFKIGGHKITVGAAALSLLAIIALQTIKGIGNYNQRAQRNKQAKIERIKREAQAKELAKASRTYWMNRNKTEAAPARKYQEQNGTSTEE